MNTPTVCSIIAASLLLVFYFVELARETKRPRLVRPLYEFGARVEHENYGCGTVCSEERPDGMVCVAFDGHRDHVHVVARWTLKRAPFGKVTLPIAR